VRNTSITVVRELPRTVTSATQVLVVDGDGQHYVVSSVVAPFTGFETLVFRSDADGKVTDWLEVAGGRGMSRDEAILDLQERVATRSLHA
jgi:hypothetical protein